MDLVFSDVHADIGALDKIIDFVESEGFVKSYGKVSRIINLGDLLERGSHPREVLQKVMELQRRYPVESVIGNHDEAFLYNRKVSGSSLESLDAHARLGWDDLAFFEDNGDGTFGRHEFVDYQKGLVCVHGGPVDPKRITPEDVRYEESWLYQKSWQRVTEEEFEFFSFAGYHYTPLSAFEEVKNSKDMNGFVILCGHQHEEAVFREEQGQISSIINELRSTKERMSGFDVTKMEVPLDGANYLVRLGLAGPEGYYGPVGGPIKFGVFMNNPRKIVLFTLEQAHE